MIPPRLVQAAVSALHDQFFCGCEWGYEAEHHPADPAEWEKAARVTITAAFGALPRIGWLHPAYSMSTILNDGQKEALENRADDKTYKDGFLAVYSEPTT